jgi:hypothetical protein
MSYVTVWLRRRALVAAATSAVAVMLASGAATAASISFSTFVTSTQLSTGLSNTQAIAFNFAGDKFVGSVYFGANNNQLYSTDLSGGNLQKFGAPIPNFSGEVVVAAGLGNGGFTRGDVYAGNGSGPQIEHFTANGSSQNLFATVPDNATVRQIFFDPGSSFGGQMLVSTSAGHIYSFDSAGHPTTIASIGADIEGLDIATSNWGPFAGDLMFASEALATVKLVSPTGVVTPTNLFIPSAETVSFVPLNLGVSGSPLEGFYVANYPVNVQKAGASQFASFLGDAIVTSEDSSGARIWGVHYTGGGSGFVLDNGGFPIGNLPNQSEDGIFVTEQRLAVATPEPSSFALLGLGGLALAGWRRKRKRGTCMA